MQVTVDLFHMVCGNCGVHFAVDEAFHRDRKDNGGGWYCPNGHLREYREPEVVRLRRSLEQAQQAAIDARTEAKNARAHAARELTQRQNLQRRINAGVCPHCHRTFQQVARHVARKHPQQAPDPVGRMV